MSARPLVRPLLAVRPLLVVEVCRVLQFSLLLLFRPFRLPKLLSPLVALLPKADRMSRLLAGIGVVPALLRNGFADERLAACGGRTPFSFLSDGDAFS